ncbi:MAG: single-stranded DNA-binding protein [Candidatus Abyssubacteria bacterium]
MSQLSMIELNKVFLAGRLTQDPELRYTPSGVPVTTLRMAVNTTFFSRDSEKKEEVLYISVVVWRKRAESCVQYLRKGSPLVIEGRLQSRQWEAQDGQKRTIIEVQADRVQFLEWSDEGGGRTARAPASDDLQEPPPPQDDDIPF